MATEITFPDVEPRYVFEWDRLAFPAVVGGRAVEVLVTGELLMKCFGAKEFTEAEFRGRAPAQTGDSGSAQHQAEMGWIGEDDRITLTSFATELQVAYDPSLGDGTNTPAPWPRRVPASSPNSSVRTAAGFR